MTDTAKPRPELVAGCQSGPPKILSVQIPVELVARVDRALAAEGLEVREFVAARATSLWVANRIGGAPGVPRLLAYDGPALDYWAVNPHG